MAWTTLLEYGNKEIKMTDRFLDTTGSNCPIPIIKTKKELREMDIGQTLKLISTDPGAVADIKSLCDALKQELVSSIEEDNKFIFIIRRSK